jgi:RNA polymerase sigma-70 factor (ECF subfamily)
LGAENRGVAKVNVLSDEQADYEELYHTHQARVVHLCRLFLEDVHEAEDVAQEVFVKLLHAHRTETRPISWGPWLTRVTVNACRDRRRSGWWKWWRRSHATNRADAEVLSDAPSPSLTPEQAALGREAYRRIWQAFRELPRRQQEVFALRYLEELSTDEVADTLGLSVGSVKQHLFRAVRRLRGTIGGEL